MAKNDKTEMENLKLLSSNASKKEIPVQERVILKPKIEVDEFKVNFFMETSKYKQLKAMAVERDTTVKELINNALDKEYFTNKKVSE